MKSITEILTGSSRLGFPWPNPEVFSHGIAL
jgi:hypothetical protein